MLATMHPLGRALAFEAMIMFMIFAIVALIVIIVSVVVIVRVVRRKERRRRFGPIPSRPEPDDDSSSPP